MASARNGRCLLSHAGCALKDGASPLPASTRLRSGFRSAQIIFYLLLLSLAERIGFDFGFLIAGVATVTLLSANAGWIFSELQQAIRASAVFSLLYLLIYLLLRLEDNSLLVDAIASFLAVAAVMYFTRRIDWYSSLPEGGSTDARAVAGATDTR